MLLVLVMAGFPRVSGDSTWQRLTSKIGLPASIVMLLPASNVA